MAVPDRLLHRDLRARILGFFPLPPDPGQREQCAGRHRQVLVPSQDRVDFVQREEQEGAAPQLLERLNEAEVVEHGAGADRSSS
ncbi:hypothetical protein [Rhodococcus koreensis]|uniref:hypothetical protein n=1 Tax=Rhodococcus koreensis TaxID=99653 RepID=UPI0036DC71D7